MNNLSINHYKAYKIRKKIIVMGSIELNEIQKRVLPNCKFKWHQRVVNQSPKILDKCPTKIDIDFFLRECESNIKNLENKCRITFNAQIQSFSGDEYSYIVYFYSEKLSVTIKVAINIDVFEQVIVVGNMDIATIRRKEAKERFKYSRYISR